MNSERGAADRQCTVRADEISVRKVFLADEFSIPVIRFVIASERDEPALIRLAEEVPKAVPVGEIGFHPEYESHNWTEAGPHRLEFERTITPGATVETMYGVSIDGRVEPEAFLTEPELLEIRPAEERFQLDAAAETVDGTTIEEVNASSSNERLQELISEEPGGAVGQHADQGAGDGSTPTASADDDPTDSGSRLDLGTTSSLDDRDATSSFDDRDATAGLGDRDSGVTTSRSTGDDSSFSLDERTGSPFGDESDGSDEGGLLDLDPSGDGLTDLSASTSDEYTVEVDWTDFPPAVRKALLDELTATIEQSIPLETIVREAVETRVDELFDAIDQDRLMTAVADEVAADNVEAIGTQIAAELVSRDVVPTVDEASSRDSTGGEATPQGSTGDESSPESSPDSVTLLVDGEQYSFENGETFGRRDAVWRGDLVAAAGGADQVKYVSSIHLVFSIEDDGAYVTDVSRNGTSLNGTALDAGKAKLDSGDTLALAGVVDVEVELDRT